MYTSATCPSKELKHVRHTSIQNMCITEGGFFVLSYIFLLGSTQNITNTIYIYILVMVIFLSSMRISTLALENIDKSIKNMTLRNVH